MRVNEAKRAKWDSVGSRELPARGGSMAAPPGQPILPEVRGSLEAPGEAPGNGARALRAAEAPEGRGQAGGAGRGRGQRPAGRKLEERRGLEVSAETVCVRPAAGRRGVRGGLAGEGAPFPNGRRRPPRGRTDRGREGQHAPNAVPRPAAAPGRHADLPGAPARALSPAPACARARRPPAHLALAQPSRLLRPFHCVRDLGAAVVSEGLGE